MSNKNINYVTVIEAFFDHDPETAKITWKDWVSPKWFSYKGNYDNFMNERAGKPVVFSEHRAGHLRTRAAGISTIYAHQIVWVLTYGKMPDYHIDHIDGNPKNNVVENLRDVERTINMRNRRMMSNNTSGFTGVYWDKINLRWQSGVSINGRNKNLGYYNTVEEAADARKEFLENNPDLGFTNRHGKH